MKVGLYDVDVELSPGRCHEDALFDTKLLTLVLSVPSSTLALAVADLFDTWTVEFSQAAHDPGLFACTRRAVEQSVREIIAL